MHGFKTNRCTYIVIYVVIKTLVLIIDSVKDKK